jgi:DNA polymerase III delta subunit
MIYFLYGKDTIKSRKKLHELLDFAKKKRPDAELFKINTENWSEPQMDELLVSQGLFDEKYTVVLDNLFEKKDIKSFILDKLDLMAESEQLFLMLETSVDAPSLKKIEKFAKQVQEFAIKEEFKKEYNIFSVTNGILERDKRKLWVSYIDSLNKGFAPEEIHGIFFWQIKNMIIASREKSQAETGLSPFVYKNALTGARKYKTEELTLMSNNLLSIIHNVRTGNGDIDIMLEKWVLSI